MAKRQGAAAKTKVAPARPAGGGEAVTYDHPTATTPLRPDVGTQAQFRKRKPPTKYRYDSSLSPALDYDGQNPARERGERHLATVQRTLVEVLADLADLQAKVAAGDTSAVTVHRLKAATVALAAAAEANRALSAMSGPFLDWAGKAERVSFDVPTLPLFVHERLSTRAIIETLAGHKRDQQLGLFNDPQRSTADQILKAYEHQEKWANRMVLGDSLVVMNSLLGYEGLGGQVQMIYMDPPYGVKFGSNFQPFVRKRDVAHNDDADMTREPEMVQAYRDTWELGLHSYLTYLRDRLLVARELLHPGGSVFVQISDDNLHHVREVMDEVFGANNSVCIVTFRTTGSLASSEIGTNSDYVLWYAKCREQMKYRRLYKPKNLLDDIGGRFSRVQLSDGTRRVMSAEERADAAMLPVGARIYRHDNLVSQGVSPTSSGVYKFDGHGYSPPANSHWKTDPAGLDKLAAGNRLAAPTPNSLTYVRYLDDFPVSELTNVWADTQTGAFTDLKTYVVQTNTKVVARCLLMTTDPGDLVLDPTCGSGTAAYVAEQWGRRWITVDVSRVPLALARQRLLTATFPFYQLRDEARGPAGGFVYKRKQNTRGEEVGGIVPHVTLKSIANNEPPAEEVLVDRPEEVRNVTRVTGPFAFEATIPTPSDWDAAADPAAGQPAAVESAGSFVDRMLEVLRKSPVIRLDGGRTLTLRNVRVPARTMSLSAEATVDHAPGTALTPEEAVQVGRERSGNALPLSSKPVAIVFGPENGAISERLVWQAIMEAKAKSYAHVYVFGFAISATPGRRSRTAPRRSTCRPRTCRRRRTC